MTVPQFWVASIRLFTGCLVRDFTKKGLT